MIRFFFLFITISFSSLAETPLPFPEQGDIWLEIHGHKVPPRRIYFLAPHQSEQVLNRYLSAKAKRKGVKFIILRQDGERHIKLNIQNRILEVDPNRIYTPRGAMASLLSLNPGLGDQPELAKQAHQRAVNLGIFIMEQMGGIQPGSVIVAIHNNTDGFDDDGKGGVGTISIVRYKKKQQDGAKYIKDVFHGKHDEDDLFFLTEPEDYAYLGKKGFNVILQHPQVADINDEDDGSLSVLAEKRDVRYFNIEAQRDPDHLQRQKKMLKALFKLLKKTHQ